MTSSIQIGSAGALSVDFAALKANAKVNDYIWIYGLKQILNDAHSAMTAKVEANTTKRNANKMALAKKKLASLLAGEIAQSHASTGSNAVEREAFALATAEIEAALKKIGRAKSTVKKDAMRAMVDKHLEKNKARFMIKAAEVVAARVTPDMGEIDIEALMSSDETATEDTAGNGE